jgi:hypothetical protein
MKVPLNEATSFLRRLNLVNLMYRHHQLSFWKVHFNNRVPGAGAYRFYLPERFDIKSYHFAKSLR